MGAARLAGLAEGVWSPADVSAPDISGARFSPADPERADGLYRTWRRAVERSLRWDVDERGLTPSYR